MTPLPLEALWRTRSAVNPPGHFGSAAIHSWMAPDELNADRRCHVRAVRIPPSRSMRSEVQDQPEHPKARASERREKKGAVDHHRKVVGWASGTCMGCPCRTPDRFISKRPETALTDHPPTRRARSSSRIVPTRPWVGMLGSGVDFQTIQVSTNDNLGTSRAVAPVSSAAF
jgi:hypothetical protein